MKMKISLFQAFAIILISNTAFSQKGIKGLINAERSFASYTTSHTIREGFLQYMDSAGIIFRQGNALNALDTYGKQKPGPAILSWQPAFAILSASGDMGVTTGPYELRAKSLQDTPVARGSFSSVWQINKKGEWKNLADLGVSYNTVYPAVKQVKEIVLLSKTNKTGKGFDEVLAIDKKFNQALQEKNKTEILSYLSPDSWLNIDGEMPIAGIASISKVLLKAPEIVLLNSFAGNISTAGDLAYIYGSVSNGNKKENYLRIWIFKNRQWQIILQTIKW